MMKHTLTLFAFFLSIACFAQADSVWFQHKFPMRANFIAKVDIRHATKDGIYLEGYVVNIAYEKARALDGKTVRIRGKVTIVKDINNDFGGEVRQGREVDTKHILKPRIDIIE